MAKEIERKFLMDGPRVYDFMNRAFRGEVPGLMHGDSIFIEQGYIPRDGDVTVRVRVTMNLTMDHNEHGYLTIKGRKTGISRDEFEYEIDVQDARFMLEEYCKDVVLKTRRTLYVKGSPSKRAWEIDEFKGGNAGLYLAEMELNDESEDIPTVKELQDIFIREVTHDPQYRNSNLSKFPYKNWPQHMRV